MTRNLYKQAFDRIEPDRSLVARTEAMLLEGHRSRPFLRAAAIAAILLALLVAGGAVAVGYRSGILQRLFGTQTPTPTARDAMLYDAGCDARDGLRLTLNEALLDQNTLNLAWTVQSTREEPVYCLMEYEIDDGGLSERMPAVLGFPYGGSSSDVGDMTLVQLSLAHSSQSSYAYSGWTTDVTAPVHARVIVRAYTTNLKPTLVENFQEDLLYASENADKLDAIQALESRGEIGVSPDFLSYVGDYGAYQKSMENLMAQGVGFDRACIEALTDSGLFQKLTTLTVELELAPNDNLALYSLPEPRRFELPGRSVTLTELRFDAASTRISYDVALDEVIAEESGWIDGNWYLVVDPENRVRNVDWSLSMSAQLELQQDARGHSFSVIHVSMASDHPAIELTEVLTCVPTCPLERKENESSQNYWQRMAELAKPKECFTLALTE